MALPLLPLLAAGGVGAGLGALAGTASTGSSMTPQAGRRSGNFLTGYNATNQQVPRFTPDQQQALARALQQALGGLQANKFDFGPIEQQARTSFQQRTIPTLAERFTAMGGQQSSAFNNALGQAGAGLEESLAALRSQYGLKQQALLQNLLGMGLAPQFENMYSPATSGFLGGIAPAVGQGTGLGLLSLLGLI